MEKEEILRKSREQKEDEGLIYKENMGRQYGFYGLTVMISIYCVIDISIGGSINAPMSMWFAFLGAEYYGKYRVNKRKREILESALGILMSIAFLRSYLLRDLVKIMGY